MRGKERAVARGVYAAVAPFGYAKDAAGAWFSAKAVPDVFERYVLNHGGLRANGPGQDVQGYRFITDTLGGNGSIAASAPATAGSGALCGELYEREFRAQAREAEVAAGTG